MNIADRAGLYRDVRRSFLLTADQTRAAIEASGFRARIWRDDTSAARAFFSQLAQTAQSSGLSLGLVTGPDFRVAVGNLARSVMEGRVAVLTGVFEAV